MTVYAALIRPLLFRLSPDRAHELARRTLRVPLLWRALGAGSRSYDARLETRLAGLPLRSPVGLAPGFDKNAEFLPSLAALGFGYLVVGSITRQARWGNPYPRLVRYPDRLSLSNSMGLPNDGLDAAVRRLSRFRATDCPIIASVAGFSADELLQTALAIEPFVQAVEIGLVCPNTTETERLEELRLFRRLAEGLGARKRKPVFVKLPPHHTDQDRERILAMVDVCVATGLDGLSVSGTRAIIEPRLGMGRGSLAGRDTLHDALRIVRDVAQHAAGRLAIKAAGGVFTGADAFALLQAGANTVELYSAFIYRGWAVAAQINQELSTLLTRNGIGSVRELAPGVSIPSQPVARG